MKPNSLARIFLTLALAATFGLAQAAEGDRTVKGQITDVQPGAHRLTIKTDAGQQLTLQVDDRSRLQMHQQQAKLGDFQKGMRVQVSYESRDGTNRVLSLTNTKLSAADVKRQFQDALQTAKSYTYQQKPQYEAKLKEVLRQVDRQLDDWKAQAERATGQARKDAQAQIEQLKPLRAKVEAQLQKVKSASAPAWEDIKAGVGSAFDDLQRAFEKASAHFQ